MSTTTAPARAATPIFDQVVANHECEDPTHAELLDLMREHDLDQWQASLIVYGPGPDWDAPWEVQKAWCTREVRRIAANVARARGARA